MSRWLAALLGVLVVAGCGESDRPKSAPNDPAGGRSSSSHRPAGGAAGAGARQAGSGEAGVAAGAGGQGIVAPEGGSTGQAAGSGGLESGQAGFSGAASDAALLAPLVTIQSPESAAELGDASPVTSGTLEVVCNATKGPDPDATDVKPSTVSIVLTDADAVEHTAAAVTPGEKDQYTTSFVIGEGYAPGLAEIRCIAEDQSSPPTPASASSFVYIDLGPTIEIDSPAIDAAKSVKGAVSFKYRIVAVPLAEDDPESEVSGAQLLVGGRTFELEEDPQNPGTYRVEVNFSDAKLFSEPPTGDTNVVVRASNSRDPDVTREIDYSFTLDGKPPAITVEGPADAAVVGGLVKLRFTVEDDLAGVEPTTIQVKIGKLVFNYETAWGTGPDYVFEFDAAREGFGASAQLSVMIAATDKAGNVNDPGATRLLYLDGRAPLVSLDPLPVREVREATGGYECSHVFDPVGDDSKDDLSVTHEAALLRAMVWERANSVEGQTSGHPAHMDEQSVYIYLQPDPEEPLLIDTNEDDVCDALAVAALDESHGFINLVPISDTGASDFRETAPGDSVDTDPAMGDYCVFGPAQGDPPDKLCSGTSDMTRIIGQKFVGLEPAIYGIGPLNGVDCTGVFWELGSLAPADYEGWMCLAARAADKVGNVGVSAPLRLCLDRTDAEHPDVPSCASSVDDAPSCTDGCTPPSIGEWERFIDL